jgi:hypothetical protein
MLLTVFGVAAVGTMLLTYALEERSRHFTLAFSGACVAASLYGFAIAALPFAVLEAIWAVVALRRWRQRLGKELG